LRVSLICYLSLQFFECRLNWLCTASLFKLRLYVHPNAVAKSEDSNDVEILSKWYHASIPAVHSSSGYIQAEPVSQNVFLYTVDVQSPWIISPSSLNVLPINFRLLLATKPYIIWYKASLFWSGYRIILSKFSSLFPLLSINFMY
jgi:hypothetical protein